MDDDTFNRRLQELIQEIACLPPDQRKQLVPIVEETKQRHEDIKQSVDKVTRSLTDLRILLKYVLFDLEATKRERDKLKKMIDNQSSTDDEDDDRPDRTESEM